jgi:hypothetical protein
METLLKEEELIMNKKQFIGEDPMFKYYITDLGNGMIRMQGEPTEATKRSTELEKERLRIRDESTMAWLDSVMQEPEYKKPKTVMQTIKEWLD